MEKTYFGKCYDCGDVWQEDTPPVVCPECHSFNVANIGPGRNLPPADENEGPQGVAGFRAGRYA